MGIAIVPTALAAGVAAAVYALHSARMSWRKNIEAAKRSGFKYIVSPISPFGLVSQLTHKLWIPIVKTCLPKSWWEDWIPFLISDWSYTQNHAAFAHHDALLIASPYDTVLLTDNAELIRQIARDREAFPKPMDSYEVLRLFGDNVLASEGARWKAHRKVTAGSFGERNAGLVFAVSVEQAGGLVRKWLADQGRAAADSGGAGKGTDGPVGGQGKDGGGSKAVETIDGDTMRLALNIISYVGFGLKLSWPGEELAGDSGDGGAGRKYTALEATEGFTMSFVDAVANVLDLILYLLICPQWLLRILPFKNARLAAEAFVNYKTYMEDLLTDKIAQIRSGSPSDAEPGMDIMGHLVRSTYSSSASACPFSGIAGKTTAPPPPSTTTGACPGAQLSRSDIIGNAFIMLVAGHETTANALHFTLLELAANPSAQRALQRDVDAVVGGMHTEPSGWRYEEVVGPLLESMVGACMLETLRKMPSVVEIPKIVAPAALSGGAARGRVDVNQVLFVDGERRVLTPGTKISLVAAAAHRNPRYWPSRRSRVTDKEHDLDDFVPERWFAREAGPGEYDAPQNTSPRSTSSTDPDTVWVNRPSTTAATTPSDTEPKRSIDGANSDDEDDGHVTGRLFRPERGAYIPFSEGPRSCLGRRIAQVEIVAVLAVIFQRYSLELAVDEFVPREKKGRDVDEVVEGMGKEERRALYLLAQERCRQKIRGATSVLTLRMQGGEDVPVRLVRRGEEKFVSWVE